MSVQAAVIANNTHLQHRAHVTARREHASSVAHTWYMCSDQCAEIAPCSVHLRLSGYKRAVQAEGGPLRQRHAAHGSLAEALRVNDNHLGSAGGLVVHQGHNPAVILRATVARARRGMNIPPRHELRLAAEAPLSVQVLFEAAGCVRKLGQPAVHRRARRLRCARIQQCGVREAVISHRRRWVDGRKLHQRALGAGQLGGRNRARREVKPDLNKLAHVGIARHKLGLDPLLVRRIAVRGRRDGRRGRQHCADDDSLATLLLPSVGRVEYHPGLAREPAHRRRRPVAWHNAEAQRLAGLELDRALALAHALRSRVDRHVDQYRVVVCRRAVVHERGHVQAVLDGMLRLELAVLAKYADAREGFVAKEVGAEKDELARAGVLLWVRGESSLKLASECLLADSGQVRSEHVRAAALVERQQPARVRHNRRVGGVLARHAAVKRIGGHRQQHAARVGVDERPEERTPCILLRYQPRGAHEAVAVRRRHGLARGPAGLERDGMHHAVALEPVRRRARAQWPKLHTRGLRQMVWVGPVARVHARGEPRRDGALQHLVVIMAAQSRRSTTQSVWRPVRREKALVSQQGP
eukprot:CAMPEP_0119181468 /NCGR_PEP_ID=MMETSP1315-20130426/59508_1 /TAXON_ID=676789 /ORGANISM="Prasinoderma singularis, Strain RCC927" /LENGTH=581 /DNA_ID=CAMNT_0007175789 /DNA_START=109 /DNA_END=1855 /DNA_ORIENTATION=-